MSNKSFNTKPHYPYTYGDTVTNEGQRLSDQVIRISSNKKVQQTASCIFFTALFLGSMTESANAIPPEAGDYAASAAAANECIPKVPDGVKGGTIGGTGANAQNFAGRVANQDIGIHNPMQGIDNIPGPRQAGQGPRINPGPGNQGVHYRFPGPPVTPAGQAVNTGASVTALAFICLQGYWGNPVFMWGCGGMVLRFLFQIGGITNL